VDLTAAAEALATTEWLPPDPASCRILYLAVLLHAFRDACVLPDAEPEAAGSNIHREQARAYLLSRSLDLRMVCGYAGVDPEYLHRKVAGLAAAGWIADRVEMPDFRNAYASHSSSRRRRGATDIAKTETGSVH